MFLIVEKWSTLDFEVVERDNCVVYCVTTLTSSFILNSTPFPRSKKQCQVTQVKVH